MMSKKIHSIRFNQEYGCFTCASEMGLRIYNVDPLAQKLRLSTKVVGSVTLAEMLFRTNIIALLRVGKTPEDDEKSVVIWDDSQRDGNEVIMKVKCAEPVISVRIKRDKLIVVLRNKVYVFSFPNNPKIIKVFETRDNPKGLCEVSPCGFMMVFPSHNCGSVEVVNMDSALPEQTLSPVIITAHKTELACLALNQNGSLLATASVKGTLIRIFDTSKKTQVLEVRRGADPAKVYCISFSLDSAYLCASSDKGTVHIFAVKETQLNKRSSFKQIGILGVYGASQWGLANFTVPPECACACAFGSNLSVIAICIDGSFHKYVFTKEGNCNREAYDMFLDISDDMD